MMFRGRGMGRARPQQQPLPWDRQEPEEHIARFLDTEELARLGRAFDAREVDVARLVAQVEPSSITPRSEETNLGYEL